MLALMTALSDESQRTSRALACLLALVVLGLSACRTGEATLTPASTLPGSSWRLVAMDDRPLEHYALPTLEFGPDGLGGDTGCNRYTASYELNGASLRIADIGMTRRACPPPIMERELRYLELLAGARSVEVTAEFLVIECEGADAPLRFRRSR